MSEEEMERVRDGFNLRRLFTPFHWQHSLDDLFPAPRFSVGTSSSCYHKERGTGLLSDPAQSKVL
jgi:hypothetical protein